MIPGRRLDREEFWADEDQLEQWVRDDFPKRPCFGVEGWSGVRRLQEWAFGTGTSRTLVFHDGDRHVIISTTDLDPFLVVTHMKRNLLAFPTTREQNDSNRAVASGAPTGRSAVLVDSEVEPFDTWDWGGHGWAAGHRNGLGIAIRTSNVPIAELRLARVIDIEQFINGRRADLRSARGED
jgi:hypothetical protein